jgi:hypothetical protein
VDIAPKTHILDNKTLKDLIDSFENEFIIHYLVILYEYKNNQPKRAIQTHKAYFKMYLEGIDSEFLLSK